MARSLNVIHLIGNLTRDPELRYTGSGRAVCTFGLATNRSWKTEGGELKEESSFHRVVAWEKLAEQCSQLLVKGRKVYVQGRLAYRSYQKDDETREVAEIVIEDMLLLDSKPVGKPEPQSSDAPQVSGSAPDSMQRAGQKDPAAQEQHAQHASHAGRYYTAKEIADDVPF